MILTRLREAPCTVTDLAESAGMELSAVSHQLRLLRNLGLVTGTRSGKNIVYALYDNHVAAAPKGSEHALAVLTEADVEAMRDWYAAGTTQQAIADYYNICRAHVGDIVRGLKWKHAGGIISGKRKKGFQSA